MASVATRRHGLAVLLAVLVTAGLLLGFVDPAGAHGDDGAMTITSTEQIGPATVRVEVGIVFASDNHLATDASVSATLTGPDGATVGPTPLAKQPGNTSLYRADIAVPAPGSWAVAVTSTNPTSRASGTVEVAAPPSTTTSPSTTSTPATSSGAATASSTPGTTEAQLPAATTASSASGTGGSSTSGALIMVAVVAVVALGVGGVLLARRRST